MKFKGIEKITTGKFLSYYNIEYENTENKKKVYEMVSRNPNIKNFSDLHDKKPDAVVMIMHNQAHDKILVQKEYRMAMGEWVYNFPAGLIDNDELPEVAARRELMEETGLHVTEIEEILGESYSAVGLSNEKTICILGTADGEFKKSHSAMEEINANWYTKEEIRNLLKTEKFSARAQIYLYLWSK